MVLAGRLEIDRLQLRGARLDLGALSAPGGGVATIVAWLATLDGLALDLGNCDCRRPVDIVVEKKILEEAIEKFFFFFYSTYLKPKYYHVKNILV